MMMMIKMHWFWNCKLQLICLFTAFVYSCVYACVFACVFALWFACRGESFMEVPLACFDRQGGAGRDFKSIKCLLELTLCGIWLELKLVYVCGHGSKLSQDLTAHPLSNCLAFVIWLWQWHESTLSWPLSMLQPWGMTHLSLLCWIESMYLLLLKRELLSSKSS